MVALRLDICERYKITTITNGQRLCDEVFESMCVRVLVSGKRQAIKLIDRITMPSKTVERH